MKMCDFVQLESSSVQVATYFSNRHKMEMKERHLSIVYQVVVLTSSTAFCTAEVTKYFSEWAMNNERVMGKLLLQ